MELYDPLADDSALYEPEPSSLFNDPHCESPFLQFWLEDYDWRGFSVPGQITVPLSQGFFAFIGEEDADLLEGRRISAHVDWDRKTGLITKVRARLKHQGKMVLLHRFLMGARSGSIIEHVNHLPLDCRRLKNLWNTSSGENNANTIKRRSANPGIKRGVVVAGDKFYGKIQIDGEVFRSAYTDSEVEAHQWYLDEYQKHYGRDMHAKRPEPSLPVFPPRKKLIVPRRELLREETQIAAIF